jgi:hypothetical protein
MNEEFRETVGGRMPPVLLITVWIFLHTYFFRSKLFRKS